MALASLLMHTTAFIFHISFFINLSFFSTEKSKGYGRVPWMSIIASAENCVLCYTVEEHWLFFLDFVLFHWYVEFIAMHIAVPILWFCFFRPKTWLHDMYWTFTIYCVIQIGNLVVIVIIRSFGTTSCNFNILKRAWSNNYVYKYDSPKGAGTSTAFRAVEVQSICTCAPKLAVYL